MTIHLLEKVIKRNLAFVPVTIFHDLGFTVFQHVRYDDRSVFCKIRCLILVHEQLHGGFLNE